MAPSVIRAGVAASLSALALVWMPGVALAKTETVVIPYSVTFTTTGFTGEGSVDGADLFGGGALVAGLPFVDSDTTLFSSPLDYVWGQFFTGFNGQGTDTLSLNGHSFTINGEGNVTNIDLAGPDRRAGGVKMDAEPSGDLVFRDVNGLTRYPSQWGSDPGAENIFLDNTVTCTNDGLYGYSGTFFGDGTNIALTDESISSQTTYTTFTNSLPEPNVWIIMLVGLGAVGAALRGRRTPLTRAP